jgi:folate-binding protein YgfZ
VKTEAEIDVDRAERGALYVARAFDTIRVTGPDRLSWLNGLVTCDLAKARPGDAALGLAVAKNGKIETELFALVGEEDVLLGVAAGVGEALVARLDRHLIMEDAAIALESAFEWLVALGPKAGEALASGIAAGARGGLVTRAGGPLAVLAAPSRAALVDGPLRAIDPSGLASSEGWERVRTMRGIAERGVDYSSDNYAQEAALERDAVSFEKGCYLGQEAVFMLEKRGHVAKRLVQLRCDARVARGAEINDPDRTTLGAITTSIDDGAGSLALGYVKYKHARAGRDLRVGGARATVTERLAIGEQ